MFYTNPYSKLFWLKSKSLQNSLFILAFDLSRSTAGSTDPMTGLAGRPSESTEVLAGARIRVHVARSTRRSTAACLTVTQLLSVCLGRPGGRPLAYNGSFILYCGRPAGRPTDPLNSKRLFSGLF